jgi:ribosomal protein S18 acetylase RimI-like enzyme
MLEKSQTVEMRDFRPEDGAACHRLRRDAFLGVFGSVLSQEAAQAGAESYSAFEFAERIGAMTTLVALTGNAIVGFCAVRMVSRTRGELLYLYVAEDHRGTGVGAALALHAEQRMADSYPELETLYLDTAVPDYNQLFWERMGYRFLESSVCRYPTGSIPAVRLEKRLRNPPQMTP